jgi:type VI secretion system FHA domain protein
MSHGSPSVSVDRFAFDPFAASAPPPGGFVKREPFSHREPGEDPFVVQLTPPSIKLPREYDPLVPDPAEALFGGAIQPDHSPHVDDAFRPPAARALLPDDWDRELTPLPATSSPSVPTPEAPVPVLQPRPPAEPVRISAPPAAAPATVLSDDLLAAFLRGVGLPDARPADPAAAMEALGEAFRALVSGLRLALIARSAIKAEFRIAQTVIRSRGNNPVKFSADDEDALLALLGAGRRTEMRAGDAVADALRDIRLHEIATVAAMRSAVRELISRFDPVKLRLAAERGGMYLVPMQQKARAWDAFEARFTQTAQALTDDFDSIFGRAFGFAYEQALNDGREREPEQ